MSETSTGIFLGTRVSSGQGRRYRFAPPPVQPGQDTGQALVVVSTADQEG